MSKVLALKKISRASFVATLPLLFPLIGLGAAVEINGTCYGPGSCTNPSNPTDSASVGNPVSGSINQLVTVGSDIFSLSATYSATYNGSSETSSFSPDLTYVGSTPSKANETVVINFLQDIYDPTRGPFSASTQTEAFPLVVPKGGTGSGQLFYNALPLPLVGPYGPGSYDVTNSVAFGPVTGRYLAYDYEFIFTFGANTAPGTSASSTPEPSQIIPSALALAGLSIFLARRRQKIG